MRILPGLLVLPLLAQGAAKPRAYYDQKLARRAVPLLQEVLRFPTVAGNEKARKDQQAWLLKLGAELGFTVRDAGKVTEIELPGPEGSPVLGLVVHGDVQPVDEKAWSIPPFQGALKNGKVLGRGAADDKGPIVQALLAMKALKETHAPLTYTLRLLVGSDEESSNLDMAEYLKTHAAPAFSLVLDSAFPVVVGEKGWNALWLDSKLDSRVENQNQVTRLEAGLATSIVPDRASILILGAKHSIGGDAGFQNRLSREMPKVAPGTKSFVVELPGDDLAIEVHGKSAHAGVNIEGGRNALVALAKLMEGRLPKSVADDLLAFARLAGQDLYGTGLGLTENHPVFGRMAVNVATLKPNLDAAGKPDGTTRLTINIRRTPVMTGPQLKAHLEKTVSEFNARSGAKLVMGGFFDDDPLIFDPNGKLVKRLLTAYTKATGKAEPPAISGGGTYAKRIPNAIAFGMWFPGQPYPGHDVDEQIPVVDLHRGVHVLLEALRDLACGKPLKEPFKP